MLSDWSSESIHPIFVGEDAYANEFEKFAVSASTQSAPSIKKLSDEASVLDFANEVVCTNLS